jgi:DNA-binding NarL/FixJ family response regulator
VTGAKRTILVDVRPPASWLEILRQWACSLGIDLDVTGATGIESVRWSNYDLVVIGSSMASRSTKIITLVRHRNRSARIVVFSTCPDWRDAREALLAGAVDYAPIPEDPRSLSTTLEAALNKASYMSPSED